MTLWKVTKTSTNALFFGLYRAGIINPVVEVRVYRYRWRARIACFLGNISPIGTPWICSAEMEPCWPDSNVVPLRKSV